MSIYRYQHTCGFSHDQFLKVDKDTVMLKCKRCGLQVTARQVRDKTAIIASNNDVTGVMRHERT